MAIDAFTKFVILKHAVNKNQVNAINHLKDVIFLFGTPKWIIVDQDRAFISEYEEYCNEYGIELHKIAAYTSRANGQVERVMRIIKDGLTVVHNCELQKWSKALGTLQLAINCTVSKSTGKSPIELQT